MSILRTENCTFTCKQNNLHGPIASSFSCQLFLFGTQKLLAQWQLKNAMMIILSTKYQLYETVWQPALLVGTYVHNPSCWDHCYYVIGSRDVISVEGRPSLKSHAATFLFPFLPLFHPVLLLPPYFPSLLFPSRPLEIRPLKSSYGV